MIRTVIKIVKVNPGSSFEKHPRAWAYNHLLQVLAAFSNHFAPFPERSHLPHYFIRYFVLHTCINSPRASGDNLQGQFFMEAERFYHFDHWLHVSKIALPSDFTHIFFHDFIHVYSPRAGADN